MQKTIKKTLAFLLTVVMLLSLCVPTVGAVDAKSTANNGTVVKSTSWTLSAKTADSVWNADTSDENALVVSNKSGTVASQVVAKTKVEGLTLAAGKVYTIDFKLGYKNYGMGKYLLISGDGDTSKSIGWATADTKTMIKKNGVDTSVDTCDGLTADHETIDGLTFTNYRLVLDVSNQTIKGYVLKNGIYGEALSYSGFEFSGSEFHLMYEMRFKAVNEDTLSLSDLTIYEGDLTPAKEEQPTPDYTVNFSDKTFYNWSATEGATTTVAADGSSISLTGKSPIVIAGNLNGLEMKKGAKYTIDFSIGGTYLKAQADYLNIKMSDNSLRGAAFISTPTSKSSYKTNNFVKKTNNESTTTDGMFSYYQENEWVFTPLAILEDGVDYTFYRAVVDYDNHTITVYVLSFTGEYIQAVTYEGCNFASDLYLQFTVKGTTSDPKILRDVKIYDQSTRYVKVNDGEATTELKFESDVKEYQLPALKKAGYIFAGWKVNGAETATPAGTVIPTEGLTTLEAVFEQNMSEVFVQFGNTTSSATDMRIVGLLDSLDYKAIGYKVSIKKAGVEIYNNESFELTSVYTSLTAKYGAEKVTLESLGYGSAEGYLTALTIKNIPTDNANITVELTSWQIDGEDNIVEGKPIVINFDATWANSSAAQ